MQQGFTESPLWNFKNKKKKTKETNTEVTIICNVSQIYVFNYCMEKRDGSSVKITNAEMGKTSAWKTYMLLFNFTYMYFIYGTDEEIIDYEM